MVLMKRKIKNITYQHNTTQTNKTKICYNSGIRHLVQIGALFLAGHWGKQVPHFPRRSNSFTTLPPANFSSTTTTTSTTTNTNSTPTSPNNNTNNNNSNTQNQQTSSAPSSSNSSYSSSFSVKLASDGVLVNEEIPFCCFWLEQNLKLSHLSHFRLIGLSKDFSIPKSVEVCFSNGLIDYFLCAFFFF